MKQFRLIKYAACAFAMAAMIGACSDDDKVSFLVSDHQMDFSYSPSSKPFTICTDGSWSITSDASWLHFDKAAGVGDGSTREEIQVSVDHNINEAREDSFLVQGGGKQFYVHVSQAEGHATHFGLPKLSSTLQSGETANGTTIVIPYTYGYNGQVVSLTSTLSGAGADGLSADAITVTLTAESGEIEIPLSGTPTTKGDLNIQVAADDNTINTTSLETSVVGRVIFEMHFDKFIWGGDLLGGTGNGIGPKHYTDDANGTHTGGKDIGPTTKGHDYTNLFKVLKGGYPAWTPEFIESRGMTGWTGQNGFEHPGYIKMGVTATKGILTTPALGNKVGKSGKATLTFKGAMYPHKLTHDVRITVAVSEGSVSKSVFSFQHETDNKTTVMEPFETQLTGITPNTKITFSCIDGNRFLLDDIVVTE